MSNKADVPSRYPALEEFFGGYFHQDFDLDHETIEEVISYYVKVHYREQIKQVIVEIDKLLADQSINNLDTLIDNLGCDYAYQVDNLTAKKWLTKVKKQLQEEIHLAQNRTQNDTTQKLKP